MAGASARVTEMTRGAPSSCGSRRSPLVVSLGIETMHSAWPFHFVVGCLLPAGLRRGRERA